MYARAAVGRGWWSRLKGYDRSARGNRAGAVVYASVRPSTWQRAGRLDELVALSPRVRMFCTSVRAVHRPRSCIDNRPRTAERQRASVDIWVDAELRGAPGSLGGWWERGSRGQSCQDDGRRAWIGPARRAGAGGSSGEISAIAYLRLLLCGDRERRALGRGGTARAHGRGRVARVSTQLRRQDSSSERGSHFCGIDVASS